MCVSSSRSSSHGAEHRGARPGVELPGGVEHGRAVLCGRGQQPTRLRGQLQAGIDGLAHGIELGQLQGDSRAGLGDRRRPVRRTSASR